MCILLVELKTLQVNIDTSDCITTLYYNGRIFSYHGQSTDLAPVFGMSASEQHLSWHKVHTKRCQRVVE